MRHWFFLTVAVAGVLPVLATAQSSRPPVTDMSTQRSGTAQQAPATTTAQAATPRVPLPAADAAALRKSLVDLTQEIEQLRTEVRELRGQLEVQTHELETLKNRNREALADTDKRLRELERKATPAAGTAPAGADTAAKTATAAPPSAGEQQEYDAAFNLMKQGYYEKAAKAFREFLVKHPSSELAGNAQYWVGEAQYVVRNFKQALDEFSKVVEKYPASQKISDALLKIGYCHQELGNSDRARVALSQVIARFPNTTNAKSAEKRLSDIKAAEASKAKPAEAPKAAEQKTKKQ